MRLELAACYRLFDHLGWTEMIFNHISVRLRDAADGPTYLLNRYGLNYNEVTATNLVKVGVNGVEHGVQGINPAGFVIHGAIHSARADAHCVMHTHTTAGIAVACSASGLRFDNFYSAQLFGSVSYHDFEGVTTDLSETSRIVESLGNASVMILRNHGLLAVGSTLPAAFHALWRLQRACEIQVQCDNTPGGTIPISEDVLVKIPVQRASMLANEKPGQLLYDAALRHASIRYAEIA